MSGAGAFRRYRRGDARRIRHTAGNVPGRHHHREVERICAGFVGHGFYVADLDLHLGAREDVGHRLGEDVVPLLVQQARDVSGAARIFVELARFVARLDQPADGAVAYQHGHIVHRGIGRQRKGVDRFNLLLKRVFEFLGDRNPPERPADARLHLGVLERADALGCNQRSGSHTL